MHDVQIIIRVRRLCADIRMPPIFCDRAVSRLQTHQLCMRRLCEEVRRYPHLYNPSIKHLNIARCAITLGNLIYCAFVELNKYRSSRLHTRNVMCLYEWVIRNRFTQNFDSFRNDPADTQRHDVDIGLDFGYDIVWPKFNVNSSSNVNYNLMPNTDVSWRWYLLFLGCV